MSKMKISVHESKKFEDLSENEQLQFLRDVQGALQERGVPSDIAEYLVNKKLDYLYPIWFTGSPDKWDIVAKLYVHYKHLGDNALLHEIDVLGFIP